MQEITQKMDITIEQLNDGEKQNLVNICRRMNKDELKSFQKFLSLLTDSNEVQGSEILKSQMRPVDDSKFAQVYDSIRQMFGDDSGQILLLNVKGYFTESQIGILRDLIAGDDENFSGQMIIFTRKQTSTN